MWYLAAIPMVLLTAFFIYNMIAERDVNLAIEDDEKSKSHEGMGFIKLGGKKRSGREELHEVIKKSGEALAASQGSVISVVPTIKTEEEFDLIFRAADQFSGHGLFVALDVLTAKTGIRKGKASKRTTGKK